MPFANRRLSLPSLITGLCTAMLLAATRPCVAQSAANKAAAEAVFEQAKSLMQAGDYRQACAKFEASQRLDQGIGTLLYLADCYERLGRTASAWATFREAASMAGAQGQESRQKLATQRARALEPNLIKLTIEVEPGNESILGFEVRNDGVAVPPAQFSAPFPVDPGSHRIEASAPGKKSHSEVINATRGTAHISIPLLDDLASPTGAGATSAPAATAAATQPVAPSLVIPAASPTTRSTDATRDHGRTQRVASYVAGGLGIVGVGLGTYFGVAALHDNSSSKGDCTPDPNICGGAGYNQRQDALREARISTIAFTAGGALLATALVLYFTAKPSHDSPITAHAELTGQSALLKLHTNW